MPYILNTEKDTKEMLAVLGLKSTEELYRHLPSEIKLKNKLNIPAGLSEEEVKNIVSGLSEKNVTLDKVNSFLGAGLYDHYIPSALRPLACRSEFLTAYTPYQAEISQGILQAIYEYQSYICLLTAMDVSNASLFDAGSALAEAVLMSLRVSKRNKIIISSSIHPEYKKTLYTYLSGFNFTIKEVNFNNSGFIDFESLKTIITEDTACVALQSPNFFGVIEDVEKISSLVKEKGAMTIMVTNPMSLAILKEPGCLGVDIVCGDGQVLGGVVSFGGPTFGFLATKNEFLRQMPGRIVGKSVDKDGKTAYCLTLQAREQHIKREKATSNICSNQSLNAISAAIYLSLMGKDGLYDAALYSLNLAHYLYEELSKIKNIKINFSSQFFNEFVWQIEDSRTLIKKLYKKKIIAGFAMDKFYPQLKNGILSCCTEKKTKEEIDSLVGAIKEFIG